VTPIDALVPRRRFLQMVASSAFGCAAALLDACARTTTPPLPPTPLPMTTPTITLSPPTVSVPTVTATTPSPIARAYLDEALTYIMQHSLMRDHVDFAAIRQTAEAEIARAQTPADTYPAIRHALASLGDNHSFFAEAAQWQQGVEMGQQTSLGLVCEGPVVVEVFPGSPADRGGIRVRDRILALNGTPASAVPGIEYQRLANQSITGARLTVQHDDGGMPLVVALAPDTYSANRPPTGTRFADSGYLDLPGILGSPETQAWYAATAQTAIRAVDSPDIHGWVVDLRRCSGGQLPPMLAGIGPILGEGDAGAFTNADGTRDTFGYANGSARYQGQDQAWCRVPSPYHLANATPAVAVLTGAITASSGEAVVVAFRGRPAMRSFGAPTFGVPTGNVSTQLSDGAWITVTAARDTDRLGRTYDRAIPPDEALATNWSTYGTAQDAVIATAMTWLRVHATMSP